MDGLVCALRCFIVPTFSLANGSVFDSVLDTEVLESILVVEGLRFTSAAEGTACLGDECSASRGGGGGGNSSSSQGLYSCGGSGRDSVLVSLPWRFS